MDKIAVISDIHGNKTALEAVLEDIKRRDIKHIYCLGDIVMKNANPDSTLRLIRENCEVVIMGNCDYVAANRCESEEHFWTREKIGKENCEYLSKLPVGYQFYMSGHLIRMFHAHSSGLEIPYNIAYKTKGQRCPIEDYDTMFENTEFLKDIHCELKPDVVIYAHIHTQNMARFGNKQLINTGSVGVPVEMLNKDENDEKNKLTTMASYIIIEGDIDSKNLGSLSFQFIKCPYDIQKEVRDIEESDMPNKEAAISGLTTGIYVRR